MKENKILQRSTGEQEYDFASLSLSLTPSLPPMVFDGSLASEQFRLR